jgi:hypothetical protein
LVQDGGLNTIRSLLASEPLGWPQKNSEAEHSMSLTKEWHTYSIEVRKDGEITYFVDGTMMRSSNDNRLKDGTIGIAPSCRHMEIDTIKVMKPNALKNLAFGKPTRQSDNHHSDANWGRSGKAVMVILILNIVNKLVLTLKRRKVRGGVLILVKDAQFPKL